MDAPHITLFSTPLISTWVFDETHRILFDAGDGVTAMLDSRIHKIRLAAITHTHRDHCAGLMQLLNLRGGAGDFVAVFPEGSGSARALANFLSAFDRKLANARDRKSTRLNSSHVSISYAVFCLKKKRKKLSRH